MLLLAPRWWWVVSAVVLSSAALFAFDLQHPRGVAVGALYAALTLASTWTRKVRVVLGCVLLFTALILAGWAFSVEGTEAYMGFFNRYIAIGLVWLCGAMVVSRLLATEHLLTVLEASPAGMIVADREGHVVYANDEASKLIGGHVGGSGKFHLEQIFPEGIAPELGGAMAFQSFSGRIGDLASREVECRRLDGTSFPAEVAVRPMRTEAGALFCVTLRDLTQDRIAVEKVQRLAAIVRSSRDAILAVDLEGRITEWNRGAERIYGYASAEVVGRPVSLLYPEDSEDALARVLGEVAAGREFTEEGVRRRKDGRCIVVRLTVSPLHDHRGRLVGASTIARDVTEGRAKERRLSELNAALGQATPGMALAAPSGILESVNTVVRALTDPRIEPEGRPWSDLVAPEDRSSADGAAAQMLCTGHSEITVRWNCREERFVELFLVRRLDSRGAYAGFHLFLRDVTERARAVTEVADLASRLAEVNRRLERQAHIDPLTGLLNRRGLQRHLGKLRKGARRLDSFTSVLLVDIDDFKRFNVRFAHAGGDRVLVAVAQTLERLARATDVVSRLGGDEFLVVLPDTRLGEAAMVAERMRAAVEATVVRIGDEEAHPTCSFGVAALPDEEQTIDQLVEAVGRELGESKRQGKNRVCTGGESDEGTLLHDVLRGRGLRAFQQPIVDLIEGRTVAYELLIRGPRGRYESPASFLELLHPGEALTNLDLACLRTCLDAAAALPPDATLHVNLFPSTLVDLGATRVLRELERAGPGRKLCVELNERGLQDASVDLVRNVQALREAGVQIAVDDVGFGTSCLESLILLEPEVIKLDRSFVGSKDLSRLDRLLAVAHALEARIIAEGVEDEEVLTNLRSRHMRYAQGYHLGRPAPVTPLRRATLVPRPGPTREVRSPHGADRRHEARG